MPKTAKMLKTLWSKVDCFTFFLVIFLTKKNFSTFSTKLSTFFRDLSTLKFTFQHRKGISLYKRIIHRLVYFAIYWQLTKALLRDSCIFSLPFEFMHLSVAPFAPPYLYCKLSDLICGKELFFKKKLYQSIFRWIDIAFLLFKSQ